MREGFEDMLNRALSQMELFQDGLLTISKEAHPVSFKADGPTGHLPIIEHFDLDEIEVQGIAVAMKLMCDRASEKIEADFTDDDEGYQYLHGYFVMAALFGVSLGKELGRYAKGGKP